LKPTRRDFDTVLEDVKKNAEKTTGSSRPFREKDPVYGVKGSLVEKWALR
jgi:hypothetical protein